MTYKNKTWMLRQIILKTDRPSQNLGTKGPPQIQKEYHRIY